MPITASRQILLIWATIELCTSFTLFNTKTKLILFGKNNRKVSSIPSSINAGDLEENNDRPMKAKYILGPMYQNVSDIEEMGLYWGSEAPAQKATKNQPPTTSSTNTATTKVDDNDKETQTKTNGRYDLGIGKNDPFEYTVDAIDGKVVVKDAESKFLSRALWKYGENKFNEEDEVQNRTARMMPGLSEKDADVNSFEPATNLRYEDIDQSIPKSVFDPPNVDLIWELLRNDALREAQREPLLVSFLYSTILNHPSLESALAFHLANRLASPSMISTQIMSLILEALHESPSFKKYLRADLIAVRDRDPACTCLPDVFLHYKGFHALQSQRVANYLWKKGRKTLAHFFQSQMSQHFQIDIHPNATLGSGIMLDHGTGLVIGETASVGHNCSILHHVTLGGSGKRGVDRHPKIGNGVLLGAGASVLGNIKIGDGCQIGAGTLVIGDLPEHSVAVGVPARIIGTYKDNDQPSQSMNQVGSEESDRMISYFQTDGI
mmetsp:Transcript_21865/g.32724  ORF Transcript_21865/g.32724 Transcript_21865/m.32724 type:complete len:493 (+) Transcript_21865:138-1616(+)|eukprot:CAMPEP_0203662922 /NCGR_PEP_ID=MMETSP0090-20130426/712_1 /ASSEMBLY_ACC=CAM_ASM_001088 /TAXON_ID=426623 /ORGANISM="Chaetoceros affinis, Strain CCMP159" /LENGTH=492 /DNA_ID=CAMNT_0050525767 /DNA_START=56 /DNA_END=1534 /DNA_ORIENTATION=-